MVLAVVAFAWYYRNTPRPGKHVESSTETPFRERVDKMEAHLEDLFASLADVEKYKTSERFCSTHRLFM